MEHKKIPAVTVNYACNGSSKKSNEQGMRVMQEQLPSATQDTKAKEST